MEPVDQVAVEDEVELAQGVRLLHGGQEIVGVRLVANHLPAQVALLNLCLHHVHEGVGVVEALDLPKHLGQFDADSAGTCFIISKPLHFRRC